MVRIENFGDPGSLDSGAIGSPRSVIPLTRPFCARRIALPLGNVLLEIGTSSPGAAIGVMAPGRASLLLPLEGIASLILGGRRTEPDFVALIGAGAEYECASRGRVAWAMLTLNATAVEENLFPMHSAIRRFGAFSVIRANPAAWRRAVALIREVEPVALHQPEVFDVSAARRALRSSLLEAAHELLGGPFDAPPPTVLPLAPAWQRRLVHAATAAVQADPAHLGTVAALAAALGVSEPRLTSAFSVVLGVGAARYLQLRRLVMVHSALRSSAGPVEVLAAAHGFRYGESFRRAYHALFGALPTLD